MNKIVFVVVLLIGVSLGLILREVTAVPVAHLADGGVYQGALVDGKLQGEGRLAWPDGAVYEGGFDQGMMHGRGVYRFADGSFYRGEFLRGEFHGQGERDFGEGERYVGEFKSSQMHGRGRYDSDGYVYTGDFVEDRFEGVGTITDDGVLVYSGGVEDWQYHGQGQYFQGENASWKGQFDEGMLNGDGEHIDAGGNRYVGGFFGWQYSGKGVMHYANGDRYEGDFDAGQEHGSGKVYLAEPLHGVSQYTGTWRYGALKSASVAAFLDTTAEKVESLIYSEQDRLSQALNLLQPGVPGTVEMYFLGVAGDGKQRVFGREMDFVEQQLGNRYPLQGKTVRLVNDRTQFGQIPLATTTSIERAVNAIAEKMNKDEDVLLLYMTSHGSRNHEFVLQQKGLDFPGLGASRLAQILQKSGIKWQVVMVSACYSGGFIPYLEGAHRMVMASAAADRRSFGCSDDSDMTYFAKAFFKESFPQNTEWTEIFGKAKVWIETREKAEELTPSLPQISVGAGISDHLKTLVLRDNHG